MNDQELTIEETKSDRRIQLLYSHIVYELNQIDPRMRFRLDGPEGIFKADFTGATVDMQTNRKIANLRTVIRVESSRLRVMYNPNFLKNPLSSGANSFFDEVRRTHIKDLNELYPMHVSQNTYWHTRTYQIGKSWDEQDIEDILEWGSSIGIKAQNTAYGILHFSPKAVIWIADKVQSTLESEE